MVESSSQNSDTQAPPMPRKMPKWRKLLRGFLFLTALLLIIKVMPLPMGSGSKSYAREWSARFAALNSIEDAKQKYPEIAVMKFDDGQWIYGVCKDSHASMWGGTIVVRDSRGQIRFFFGHVCGDGFLKASYSVFEHTRKTSKETRLNLDDYYHCLQERCDFTEWKP